MTIAANTVPISNYVGNNATHIFNFFFRAVSNTDVIVKVKKLDGTYVTLVLNLDYTLTKKAFPSLGGTITLIDISQSWLTAGELTTGYGISLIYNLNPAQSSKFRDWGPLGPLEVEKALDRIQSDIISVKEVSDRSLKIPSINSPGKSTELPDLAGKALKLLHVSADELGFGYDVTTAEIFAAEVAAQLAAQQALADRIAADNDAANALAYKNAASVSAAAALASQNASAISAAAALASQTAAFNSAATSTAQAVIATAQAGVSTAQAVVAAAEAAAALVSENAALVSKNAAAASAALALSEANAAAVSEIQAAMDAAAALVSANNAAASAAAAAAAAGHLTFSSIQDITANGKITPNAFAQQALNVEGAAGPQTANIAIFATDPADGTIIILIGGDDAKILKIPYSDTVNGCILTGGDCYLGKGDTLMLVRNTSALRYNELSRSIH